VKIPTFKNRRAAIEFYTNVIEVSKETRNALVEDIRNGMSRPEVFSAIREMDGHIKTLEIELARWKK
jgi:hypothetical protein